MQASSAVAETRGKS